ncbi:MAG: NAD(P)H-hydrate dehydratase [Deltaproteobacteria bacterium]|nr:MAG: NAD(P)H-hydrate dehydratase [Deltaproteobacteria bacterium]
MGRHGLRHKPVLTREDMRELDRVTIEGGVPSIDLMERAGEQVTAAIVEELPRLEPVPESSPSAFVLAGPGNNGGDGFVVARLLAARGWDVTVGLCAREPEPDSDPGVNLRRWRDLGGEIIDTHASLARLARPRAATIAVDALFGTGLVRPLEGDYHDLVSALNDGSTPVVSVDTPSGLCANTGMPLGVAVFARLTVTLGAAKPGLFCGVGPNHAGRVVVADIGLRSPQEAGIVPVGELIDADACAAWLPHRHRMAHKGELGHVLIVGGSLGKCGAVLLAARAALRGGSGLVTMAVPDIVAAQADTSLVEAMTLALPATSEGELAGSAWRRLSSQAARFDAAVVGPGMGTGRGAAALALGMIESFGGALVIDADALNVLASDRKTAAAAFAERARAGLGPVIATPHPGEMGRLLGRSSASVQEDRLDAVRRFCSDYAATVVLKGAGSIVSDGRRTGFNTSGNPGMASAGMGDVLAGLVATFAVQRSDPFEAATLATFIHGAAGDLLAERRRAPGFLAGEVADAVPEAVAAIGKTLPA